MAQQQENPFFGKDLISVDQLTPQALHFLFGGAQKMETLLANSAKDERLGGKMIAIIFYQPSTRTFTSFWAAGEHLGAKVVAIPAMQAYSSVVKGENLADTVRSISATTDAKLIVLRHPDNEAAQEAAHYAPVPVINAGSGTKEHPTQAILDIYTIYRARGNLDNLRVALVGDLHYGRTVKSLAKLLAQMGRNLQLELVAPQPLQLPTNLRETLESEGVKCHPSNDLKEVIGGADVVYMTRIQKEWFRREGREKLYHQLVEQRCCVLEESLLRRLPEAALIMHPLPRVNELPASIDDDPRAAYWQQMRNGLATRMALLAATLLPQPW